MVKKHSGLNDLGSQGRRGSASGDIIICRGDLGVWLCVCLGLACKVDCFTVVVALIVYKNL